MPKIVFLDAATLSDLPAFTRFRELGDFVSYDYTTPDEVVARLTGAAVAITNKIVFSREVIAQLPDLRLICVSATGTNNIDRAAAAERGIAVRNVAGYSTNSVAQLTLTALFTVAMDLIHLNGAVYDGTYSRAEDFTYWRHPFYELGGARYGIVGLGAIGRRVAELATAYGAKVVYHSTSGGNLDQPYPHLELEELLATSEVVSIHCGLNEKTKNLIGARELGLMKKSAYLLNMGRGGIVNEAALARSLGAGQIAGAAVDVFASEPIPADHPYLQLPPELRHKLLLTPHVAWASVEARTVLIEGVIENIKR